MGEEHHHYLSGTQQVIINYKGFKILPMVCYDIRFPVWLRRTKKLNYDLMIVVANWPERRAAHWKTLLQARAIENQSYVLGVNRIGNDGNGIYHAGDSSVINAKGEIIFQQTHQSFIKTFNINLDELTLWRNTFPVIEDADSFTFE
jgi:predicted amidohydrolase